VDFDVRVKLAVYELTAASGRPPTVGEVAERVDASAAEVGDAYIRLAGSRLLVLEADGVTIRMAPPFSGVPTQHRVQSGGVAYHANCAWDALGIPAALHRPAVVSSRCEESGEPLHLDVGPDGPPPSPWLFHCAVPAGRWWKDIVYT
jgi:hypothetical protein